MKVREDGQETKPYHNFLSFFILMSCYIFYSLTIYFYFMILKLLFWL